LFFEDAVTAARELEITLTSRNKEKGMAIPMCGVPYHAAEGYIARLIQRAIAVAICDQMEAAGPGEACQARVTRIVTPAPHAHLLRSHENNYLAAVARKRRPRWPWRTWTSPPASFRVTELEGAEIPAALEHLAARKSCSQPICPCFASQEKKSTRYLRTELEDWIFQLRLCRSHAARSLPPADAGRPGPCRPPRCDLRAGAILHYLRDTQRAALDHLDRPTHMTMEPSPTNICSTQSPVQ